GVRCALSHFCCVYNKTVVQWYTRPPQRGPVDCPSSTVPGISPHVPPDRGAAPTAPPPAGGIVLPFPRALFDSVSVLRDPLPPRPPHAAPHIMDQRRHHERADEDRIEQHAEGDDEGELGVEHERDAREGREGRGEHDPRRGDHPTRGHQPREHSPPSAQVQRLLPYTGHEEDVVVDTESDEEDEGVERHRGVGPV